MGRKKSSNTTTIISLWETQMCLCEEFLAMSQHFSSITQVCTHIQHIHIYLGRRFFSLSTYTQLLRKSREKMYIKTLWFPWLWLIPLQSIQSLHFLLPASKKKYILMYFFQVKTFSIKSVCFFFLNFDTFFLSLTKPLSSCIHIFLLRWFCGFFSFFPKKLVSYTLCFQVFLRE